MGVEKWRRELDTSLTREFDLTGLDQAFLGFAEVDAAGNVLADFDTPVSDTRPAPSKTFYGPFDPAISPDGTKVAEVSKKWFRVRDTYGIEMDPGYSGNYYNAARYYFYTKDKTWSLIYGEIFVNMESLTDRAAAMKGLLLQAYKEKLFRVFERLHGDEFDGSALDQTKWGYDLGNNNGWGNQELEQYTDRLDNAVVGGGVLTITARKEKLAGHDYTSARLVSKGKGDFLYGRPSRIPSKS